LRGIRIKLQWSKKLKEVGFMKTAIKKQIDEM